MISFTQKGDYSRTINYLKRISGGRAFRNLDAYGREGVVALSRATPKDTGLTADSWAYRIVREGRSVRIEWYNTNRTDEGTPVAILIQYGHGNGNGGYVQGKDFINPAMRPVFQQIADKLWKEVTGG